MSTGAEMGAPTSAPRSRRIDVRAALTQLERIESQIAETSDPRELRRLNKSLALILAGLVRQIEELMYTAAHRRAALEAAHHPVCPPARGR